MVPTWQNLQILDVYYTASEMVFLKETGYRCNEPVVMKACLEESELLYTAILASIHF